MPVLEPIDASLPKGLTAWLPYLWSRALFPGHADAAGPIRLSSLVILIALPGLLLYPTRSFQLLEPDEGRYAQIAREMLMHGEWIVPTLQGEPYLDKPPLLYWLTKISYSLFGVSETTARLFPGVLAVQSADLDRSSDWHAEASWEQALAFGAPCFCPSRRASWAWDVCCCSMDYLPSSSRLPSFPHSKRSGASAYALPGGSWPRSLVDLGR